MQKKYIVRLTEAERRTLVSDSANGLCLMDLHITKKTPKRPLRGHYGPISALQKGLADLSNTPLKTCLD